MFILFDANVWFSQVGLRSRNGAAIRFFALQRNATIVIPEIVQMEVEEKLTEHMLTLKKQVEDSHRQLLPLFGRLQQLHLPSEEDIRNAVANIIPDLDVPTRRLQLTLGAARSSTLKLIRKTPPSMRKEQFRDGLIWAHCLELLPEGDVYLVSEDSDFYEKGQFGKGLASELILEMQQASPVHQVFLKRSLSELLAEIQIPFELDKLQVFEALAERHRDEIAELLHSHGFGIGDGIEGELSYFATEKADVVYFTFAFARHCEDCTQARRQDGVLRLKGVGFVDARTRRTTDVQLSHIRLDYPEWQPDGAPRGSVFVSAHFGAPAVHSLRFPLDSP